MAAVILDDVIADERLIVGAGTDERTWLDSHALATARPLDVLDWRRFARIWIVAPHPDDEVLALGGSVATLVAARADVRVVAVTDGEASHDGSSTWTRARLADARPRELRRALAALGADGPVLRIGLPDGRVGAHRDALVAALADLVAARDLVLAPWRFDGHPDHEACGGAAALAAQACGATFVEYPVWMWHWATPATSSIPWTRARRLPLTREAADRKRDAIAAFASQIAWDGARPAVLPPFVLARFRRPFEVVFD